MKVQNKIVAQKLQGCSRNTKLITMKNIGLIIVLLLNAFFVNAQFETEDKVISRHYIIKNQAVDSILGPHTQPTTTLSFVDAAYAISILKNKDPMDLMKGVQEQKIKAAGDIANLMWFVSAAQTQASK